MEKETVEFRIGDIDLRLQVSDKAFRPNLTTQMLGEQLLIPEGAAVADLGCGVGPLAIAAAKMGAGRVVAIDLSGEACRCARRNARINGVAERVQVLQGDLFTPVAGMKFDVIIDDVSGVAESLARFTHWYPEGISAGGEDGAEPTLRMLAQAREHLSALGRLYFPVLSLADSERILAKARELYGSALQQIAEKMIPFSDEMKQRMDVLEALRRRGIVDYVTRRSRHLWSLKIFQVCSES